MLNEEFLKQVSGKYGFEIESITALLKDEDGNVVKSENLYKNKNKHENIQDAFNAGKQYVAINLLKNNIDPSLISKVTHFSLNYIKKLKQRIN